MIGRYRHTIPETLNFNSNILLNFPIAELLTTCRHSGFWQNEHAVSVFTVLVTVSKGSN